MGIRGAEESSLPCVTKLSLCLFLSVCCWEQHKSTCAHACVHTCSPVWHSSVSYVGFFNLKWWNFSPGRCLHCLSLSLAGELKLLPHWSWSKHISTSTSAMELLIKEWELRGVHMDLCISTSNEDVESCRSGREKTWAGKRPRSTRGARVYFSQFAQKHLLNECNEMQLPCLPFPTLSAILLWSCTKSLLAHLSYHSNNKAFLIIIHVLYYMQCLWMPGCFYDWQLLWTRGAQTLSLSGQNCFKLNTSAK